MPAAPNRRVTLGFDITVWNEIAKLAGLTTEREQAEHVGIARGTLNKVRNGHAAPGPEFIAAVRATFPSINTDRLFPIVVKAAA